MTARKLHTLHQSARHPAFLHVLPAEVFVDKFQFGLDRTAYGSHHGSSKLVRFLGPHLVNDHLHLHVKIHADRQG